MAKRKSAEQVREMLKGVSSDRAKGLTVGQACRKVGLTEQSYYRWRQLHEAEPTDAARQVRELTSEVARLKTLVADLSLETQMLRLVAKKSGDGESTTCGRHGGVRTVRGVRTEGVCGVGSAAIDATV